MKTELILLLGVLAVAGAVMIGPVSGAGGNANITGNPADYISIVETGDTTGWIFTQDYLNVNDTSCKLNVTTNRLHWTVSVSDNLDDTKLIQPGHMVEWTTSVRQ